MEYTESEIEWQKGMKAHRAFVKRLPASARKEEFDIDLAKGEYIIACKEITTEYYSAGILTLIVNHNQRDGWAGIFDFGILEGIMRFDTNIEALLARCKKTEEEERKEEEGDEDEEEAGYDVPDTPPPSTKKRKDHPAPTATPSAKRHKPSSSSSSTKDPLRRLYLQWRGRETGEGEIQLDDNNSNTGFLDFTDATCSKFQGFFNTDLPGENTPFQGYKVCWGEAPLTRSWSHYSAEQDRYESMKRW